MDCGSLPGDRVRVFRRLETIIGAMVSAVGVPSGASSEDAAVFRRKDMRGCQRREVLAASAGGKPLKVESPRAVPA
jgi:hypothetical protein